MSIAVKNEGLNDNTTISFLDLAGFESLQDEVNVDDTNFINQSLSYVIGALRSLTNSKIFSFRSNVLTVIIESMFLKEPEIVMFGSIANTKLTSKGDFLTLQTISSLTHCTVRKWNRKRKNHDVRF